MDRFYRRIAYTFLAVFPFWFGWRLTYDLSHPENWDQDWPNNPMIYGPFAIVIFVCAASYLAWLWLTIRKQAREMALQAVLDYARRKQAEGDWAEAERALRFYEKKAGIHSHEERR